MTTHKRTFFETVRMGFAFGLGMSLSWAFSFSLFMAIAALILVKVGASFLPGGGITGIGTRETISEGMMENLEVLKGKLREFKEQQAGTGEEE